MDCGDIIMKKEKSNLSFWFKQSKGLMLINPNENLVEVYKKKSKSALNMLISAIEKEELDWILDISYYAKDFGKEEILKRANKSSEFCLEVEQILDKISKDEISQVRNKFNLLKAR